MIKNKKGSMMLEFVVVLPFLMFCLWAITNMMFYINAQSTVHQAAIMSAEIVSQEMRGHVSGVDGVSSNSSLKGSLQTKIHDIVYRTTYYNSLIDLARVSSFTPDTIQFSNNCSYATIPTVCVSSIASSESTLGVGRDHDVIEVRIVAKFKPFGGFTTFFQNAKVNGFGYASLDQAERFNYQPSIK